MKRLVWFACALSVAAALVATLWTRLPPRTTRVVPIPEPFIAWLRSEHPEDLAERLRDPLEVSLRLLYFGAGDPINTLGMTINVHSGKEGQRIVTIDERYVEDDSISRVYSRIELKREGLLWIPTERRMAQQGRGVFGWTTGATN